MVFTAPSARRLAQPSGGHDLVIEMWPALYGGQASTRGTSSTVAVTLAKELALFMVPPALVLVLLLRVNGK